MIVTIDGPAGAGKSSVARQLARRLGFQFLDTGAMYRAVALSAIESNIELSDSQALAAHAQSIDIQLDGDKTFLNGTDISDRIRKPAVTRSIRFVADHPEIRRQLVELQRRIAGGRDYVSEGRDQGTVAFPEAACKIFLTASPSERARRRLDDLIELGQAATYEEVLSEQEERDRQDCNRPVGALRRAADAVEVNTDGMTPEHVVDRLEEIVRARMAKSR